MGVHWKDWCWSWNSNTLAISCKELIHWKRPWCWEGLGGRRRRGWQRMRWLNGITDSMDMSAFRDLVMDMEAWRAAIHGIAKSRTWLSNWTELNMDNPIILLHYISFYSFSLWTISFKNLIYFNWRLITLHYCGAFLPYINLNQPWVHMCPILNALPTSLPTPSLWVIPEYWLWLPCFMHWTCTGHHGNVHVSMIFSQITPLSSSLA